MKYKIGDKVRVREWDDLKKEFGVTNDGNIKARCLFVTGMKKHCGETVTISSITPQGNYQVRETCFIFSEDTFENNNKKIVITSDGVETVARLYDGNKVIKTATAKCSPDDTFDFETGAKLAYDRLMTKTTFKDFSVGIKSASDSLKKLSEALRKSGVPAEKKWRVVNRPAKVGDYIRLTKKDFSFDEVGDILKVDNVYDNGSVEVRGDNPMRKRPTSQDNELWLYFSNEYEVVEPVTAKKEKPFKLEVGKQYADGDNVIEITDAKNEGICVARYYYKDIKGDTGASKSFTDGSAFASRLKPYDPPKYYNGKVVCTVKTYPWAAYTVGKVYEFKDGRVKLDNGKAHPPQPYDPVKSLDEWNNDTSTLGKFIPFVE